MAPDRANLCDSGHTCKQTLTLRNVRHAAGSLSGVEAARKSGVEAEREPNFLLARFERRFLPWLAGKLPRWVLPDELTAVGLAAAFGVCAAYQL